MIQLFDDQLKVKNDLRVALREHQSVLVYAPTGFGKTVLASDIIKSAIDRQKRALFCVHRVDLITQTEKTFNHFDIPHSVISGSHRTNPYFPCHIASIPTLQNRLGKYPADIVFIDEAHLSAAAGWERIAEHYLAEGALLIGLSGSPERLDGKPLGKTWRHMVMGPSVASLIQKGRLSGYRAFCPSALDTSGLHTRYGEFIPEEVEELMSGKAVLSNAVQHWKQYARGKRTIAFSRNVKAAEELAAEFRSNGVMAVALDGETPQNERRDAFLAFAASDVQVITNCSLFCEGFDLSAQVDMDVTIECVLQHSPTKSLPRHIQQMGRALRKKPDPAILLDLVGNIPRLGLPDEDREWSLEGRIKREGKTSVMVCGNCFASFPPAPHCPCCGKRMEVEKRERSRGQPSGLSQVDGELKEIDKDALRQHRKMEQGMAKTLEDLIALATAKNFKSPELWAAHILTAREAAKRKKEARR